MGTANADQAPVGSVKDSASQESAIIDFDIAEQALDRAVLAFAEQAGVQVFFDSGKLAGLRSRGLQGRHSAEDGLALLLAGTPVRYEFTGARKVSLERLSERDGALELGTTMIESARDRSGDWVYEVPRSSNVISSEQIDRNPPRHVAEIVQETPGVNAVVNYQDPAVNINIRGIQDYGRVNMMIDGARQNYQQSGHQSRNGEMFVDSELISEVVIEKGPSSGVDGAGVIGGTANFKTLDIDDLVEPGRQYGLRLRSATGLGKYANGNHFKGSLAGGVHLTENLDFLAAVTRTSTGNMEPGRNGNYANLNLGELNDQWANDFNTVAYTGNSLESILLKSNLTIGDSRFTLSHIRTDTEYETAAKTYTGAVPNVDPDANRWSTFKTSNDVESRNYALDYSWTPNDLWNVKSKLYYVDTRNTQFLPDRNPGLGANYSHSFENIYQTETIGLKLENTSLWRFDQLQTSLNYGAELSRDNTSPEATSLQATTADYTTGMSGGTPEGERYLGGIFTQLNIEYDDWLTVGAGLRYDRYKVKGDTTYINRVKSVPQFQNPCTIPGWPGPLPFCFVEKKHYVDLEVDREDGQVSPTFSIGIKPIEEVMLFATYGKGWRPPSITETLVSSNHTAVGDSTIITPNPYLDAEESRNWETGVNLTLDGLIAQDDKFRAKLSYFDTRVENWVALARVKLPDYTIAYYDYAPVNLLNPVDLNGVELEFKYDAGIYYMGGSYTYTEMDTDINYRLYYMGGEHPSVPASLYYANDVFFINVPPKEVYSLHVGARFIERKLDVRLDVRKTSPFINFAAESTGDYDGLDYEPFYEGYTTFNMSASYKLTKDTDVQLNIQNITDEKYALPMTDANAVTPGPGRTVIGSLEMRF